MNKKNLVSYVWTRAGISSLLWSVLQISAYFFMTVRCIYLLFIGSSPMLLSISIAKRTRARSDKEKRTLSFLLLYETEERHYCNKAQEKARMSGKVGSGIEAS